MLLIYNNFNYGTLIKNYKYISMERCFFFVASVVKVIVYQQLIT